MRFIDLVHEYRRHHWYERKHLDSVDDIKAILSILRDELIQKGKVTISGIGTFEAQIVTVPEQTRYIPATGKKEVCPEHRKVRAHFKPCKALKEAIFLAQE